MCGSLAAVSGTEEGNVEGELKVAAVQKLRDKETEGPRCREADTDESGEF